MQLSLGGDMGGVKSGWRYGRNSLGGDMGGVKSGWRNGWG